MADDLALATPPEPKTAPAPPAAAGGQSFPQSLLSAIGAGSSRAQARIDRADAEAMELGERAKRLQADLEHITSQVQKPPPLYQSDPMQGFGSVAMSLAALGSLLTRRPLTTALSAGAEVMKAHAANDAAAAKQAFDTWKTSTDEAIKLHQFEQDAYQAGIQKLKADREGARVDLLVTSAALKDDVVKHLLETGRTDEAVSLIVGRGRLGSSLGGAAGAMNLKQVELQAQRDLQNSPEYKAAPAAQKLKMMQDLHKGKADDAGRAGLVQAYTDAPDDEKPQRLKDLANYDAVHKPGGAQRTLNYELAEQRENRIKKSMSNQEAAQLDKWVKEHPDADNKEFGNAVRAIKGASPLTAMQQLQLDEYQGHAVEGLSVGDNLLRTMEMTPMAVGVGGMAGRPLETISNWFGSDATARNEFIRNLDRMILMYADTERVSSGRPLASQLSLIKEIVGGRGWGNTVANTADAIHEIQNELFRRIQRVDSERSGTYKWDMPYRSIAPMPWMQKGGQRSSGAPDVSQFDTPH